MISTPTRETGVDELEYDWIGVGSERTGAGPCELWFIDEDEECPCDVE
jgi:hypothetical protein